MDITQWLCLIPFRIVGASSSYPLLCIVRSFIQSGVRVLLAAASSATEMSRIVPPLSSPRPAHRQWLPLAGVSRLLHPFPCVTPCFPLPPCPFFTKPHHFPAAKVVCRPISWVRGYMRMANVLMKIFLFLFTANKKSICIKKSWRTLSRHDSSCTCKIDV